MAILPHAARNLRRSPGFVLMVIAILGLGVALNAAIFTVVDCVLLRPLGYRDADRIVAVTTHFHDRNRTIPRLGGDDYNDLAAQVKAFEATAYFYADTGGIQVAGHSLFLSMASVSPRFGQVMGVEPIAGRLFLTDAVKGTEAIVGARFAKEQFGAADAALGKTLRNEEGLYTIVGVLPNSFSFPENSSVWIEADSRPAYPSRSSYSSHVIGKRKAGIDVAQLTAELASFSQNLQRAYLEDRNKSIEAVPLQENVVGKIRPTLRLLMGAVVVLLLIVCANVTHLQLVRATRKARLVAIQTALGASRARLMGYALTEAALLGLGGGVVAVLLAWPALRLLVHLAPPDVPRLQDVHLNLDVLLFSLGVSLLVMAATALLPVWRSWHADPAALLRQDSSRGLESRGVHRLRGGFMVAQVALTVALSVSAVLLARQLIAQSRQDLGFDPESLITLDSRAVEKVPFSYASGTTPEARAAQEQQNALAKSTRLAHLNATLDDLRSVVGVESAEAILGAPMGFGSSDVGYAIKGRSVFASPYRDLPNAEIRPVTPGALVTLHVPLLAGRQLANDDRAGSPPVLLINRELARQQFPGQDAVGKQIMCGYDDVSSWWTIVGIVGNSIDAPGGVSSPTFYVPVAQHAGGAADMQLLVRTKSAAITPDMLKQHLRQSSPDVAVKASTMTGNIQQEQRTSVFRSLLFGSFAAVSILLSAFGMYGVMAYTVAQRNFEFGLRFALGAQRSEVLGMVVKRALVLTTTGLVIGIALSLSVSRVFSSVEGKQPGFDAVAYAAAMGAVLVLMMLATAFPANRAARVNPNEVLRGEA